jgi:hypothetical protein
MRGAERDGHGKSAQVKEVRDAHIAYSEPVDLAIALGLEQLVEKRWAQR